MRDWLHNEEVSLAIAAVTVGITIEQANPKQGFGYISHALIQLCADNLDNGNNFDNGTVRPGCPMLLPLCYKSHYVLLIILLNGNRPEFTIMDSRSQHFNAEDRQYIYNWVYRIARDTSWWRHIFSKDGFESSRPEIITWLSTSHQPTDEECSYYTIMNAWSLALGLELDPDLRFDWKDQFFIDLRDIVHLARTGRVDWLLIYAFLRCHKFIHEGIVP